MKIGVIGIGYWGSKVAREYMALMRNGNVDEVHIFDEIQENVARMKEECPECIEHSSFGELLNSDIDGFHVCTPNSTHYDITMELLRSGKNVLIEKPMSLTHKEAKKLAMYAYNNNLVLAVGHIFRFNRAVRKVKEMYERGDLGKIWYAQLTWGNLMPSPPGRDVVYDLAPHPIDILNYITSLWPDTVSATGKAFRREKDEEVAYINMTFNGDFIARAEVSWIYPKKIRNVSIMGEKLFVSLEAVQQKIDVYDVSKDEWNSIPVDANNTIYDEAEHFIRAIQHKDTAINDGFNGSENIKVLEAAVKSIRNGEIVHLEW